MSRIGYIWSFRHFGVRSPQQGFGGVSRVNLCLGLFCRSLYRLHKITPTQSESALGFDLDHTEFTVQSFTMWTDKRVNGTINTHYYLYCLLYPVIY